MTELEEKVFRLLQTVPKGHVITYGEIAQALGNKGLARVVGNILHRNPDETRYPCFRVVNHKGELAENFVFGGAEGQRKRLEEDGIKVIDGKVDLAIYGNPAFHG